MKPIFKTLEDIRLDNALIDIITYVGQKNFELSPKGLLSYITLVHEAVNLGFVSLSKKFFKNVPKLITEHSLDHLLIDERELVVSHLGLPFIVGRWRCVCVPSDSADATLGVDAFEHAAVRIAVKRLLLLEHHTANSILVSLLA